MSNTKGSQKEAIKISPRLKKFLKSEGLFGETYEDIIWRLLGQKALTKEQSRVIKAKYEEHLKGS